MKQASFSAFARPQRSLADRLASALCLAVNTEERRKAFAPATPAAIEGRLRRGATSFRDLR